MPVKSRTTATKPDAAAKRTTAAPAPEAGAAASAPDEPTATVKPTRLGGLVDYETVDPITGHPLQGVGLLVERYTDADTDEPRVLVAPLTVLGIALHPDAVKAR